MCLYTVCMCIYAMCIYIYFISVYIYIYINVVMDVDIYFRNSVRELLLVHVR